MSIWNKGRIGAVSVGAIAIAGIISWVLLPPPITTASVLHSQGYLEVVPPSNLYGPGTLNTIEHLSSGGISLHPTCDVDPNLLSSATLDSPTVESDLKQVLGKGVDVSAKIKSFLSSISQSQAQDIRLSFRNVRILTMPDESLLRLQKKLLKDECQEAVVWNIKNGGIVCQSAAVIKSDVVYDISYREGLNSGDEVRITKALSEKMNLTADSQGRNRIIGRGLFYGVKLESNGLMLNIPGAEPVNCHDGLEG